MSFTPQIEKRKFPIFKESDLIYLDNASTTHKPLNVIDCVNNVYSEANANVHRAIYNLGDKSTRLYEDSRKKVSQFINANSPKEVIFTSGATESLNLLAYSLSHDLNEDDEILITEMEHHSNIVPWQLIAKKTKAKIRSIPLLENGELDLSESNSLFNQKTKIVSVTHMSNVLGTINPLKRLSDLAHKVGAKFIVDGAQGVPHMKVNLKQIDCDFYVFSGHKMLGPTGIGVLWGKYELLNKMEPFLGGGEMIDSVTLEESTWNEVPYKFEAGTPNFVQAIGLGEAINYLEDLDMKSIEDHERELTKFALEELNRVENIKLHGSAKNRGGVISFTLKDIHSLDLAQFLNEDNIAIRVGHHCAQPLLNKLGETSTARISFYLYNDDSDISKLCKTLKKVQSYF
tara:strand:+ start:289 stop:1491 length:1203 start_codon:yes stop_codon:yes gene_type:complete